MTDEARRIVGNLRRFAEFGEYLSRGKTEAEAADLIERLSAELDAAKRDIKYVADNGNSCAICGSMMKGCEKDCQFKWRGLCDENHFAQ